MVTPGKTNSLSGKLIISISCCISHASPESSYLLLLCASFLVIVIISRLIYIVADPIPAAIRYSKFLGAAFKMPSLATGAREPGLK